MLYCERMQRMFDGTLRGRQTKPEEMEKDWLELCVGGASVSQAVQGFDQG